MNILKLRALLLLLLIVWVGISQCQRKTVTRLNPDQQVDLSGRWNDTDSRLVAEEMVKDALARPWHSNFQASKNKQPVVIVGIIQNKTEEYITTETFISDIQREFINTGTVRVVQNSVLREAIRKERGDQQQFASVETQKKFGKELGADYMMFGTVSSITDQEGRKQVIFYQVDLSLADMETNEIVWIGTKKIKKFVRKGL